MPDGPVLDTTAPLSNLELERIDAYSLLARIPQAELRAQLEGYGYAPRFVEGEEPAAMHQLMAATLDDFVTDVDDATEANLRGVSR